MPDDLKVEPIPPVPVAIIAGTGDGGAPLTTGTVGSTPDHQPNLVISQVISPAVAIAVRFVNNYLTTLVGLVAAGLTPAGHQVLRAGDFAHLVRTCATLAIAGPALALGKDLITVFGNLERKYPLATGSI